MSVPLELRTDRERAKHALRKLQALGFKTRLDHRADPGTVLSDFVKEGETFAVILAHHHGQSVWEADGDLAIPELVIHFGIGGIGPDERHPSLRLINMQVYGALVESGFIVDDNAWVERRWYMPFTSETGQHVKWLRARWKRWTDETIETMGDIGYAASLQAQAAQSSPASVMLDL